jgi:hypothetical protein
LGLHEILIYSSPIDPKEDLIARIVEAASTIKQGAGIFAGKPKSLFLLSKGSAQTVTEAM